MKKSHRLIFHSIAILIALLSLLSYSHQPLAQDKTAQNHVQIRLVPERTTVTPNDTIWIGIEQTIDDGWHTYWVNAGDSGEPARLDWTLPDEFGISDISWPVPHKIITDSNPPLANYGYKDKVTLLQSLSLPVDLPDGPIELSVKYEILVCKDICIPEYGTETITLNNGTDVNNAEFIDVASQKLPYSLPWVATYSEKDGALHMRMEKKEAALLLKSIDQERGLDFFPYEWGIVKNTSTPDIKFDDEALHIKQKRGDRPLRAVGKLHALIAYYDEVGEYGAFELTADPDDTVAAPVAATTSNTQVAKAGQNEIASQESPDDAAKIGVVMALLFAFLGGIILNLMPCVFPVLSMKALSLCNMHGKELRHARAHGMLYTAGILVMFGLVAGTLMVLKAGGSQIGWGFQLQNPSVVLGLAWLLFIIGLNLAGFFNLSVVLSDGTPRNEDGEDTAIGSFFTGMLATIVATPCTAPFMGAALGFAIVQPPVIGMMVFLMLGLGLAIPYLTLCFFPRMRAFLPKPGIWMERFKEFLAFPMFLSALWLTWVYTGQAGPLAMLTALGGMILITFGLWLVKITPQEKSTKKTALDILAFLMLVAILTLFITDMKTRAINNAIANVMAEEELLESYTTTRYEELIKSGEPLFINMTADWCITCKVNEAVALNKPATKALFAAHKIHYLKGDWTNQNAEITAYLDRYGRNGVPLYVYYAPTNPKTGKRPKAVILPQILTPGILADKLGRKQN